VSGTRILIVDDEPRYLKILSYNLEAAGYKVSKAADGESALSLFREDVPDLVILDIFLPGIDGYGVCLKMRETSTVPIIMLTALGEEQEKVRGLRSGADDYVTKPFAAEELLARVESVLRRSAVSGTTKNSLLSFGGIKVDMNKKEVTVDNEPVDLSPTEFRLFSYLASNSGRIIPQEELLDEVWGAGYKGHYEGLRIYIWRLRNKIEKKPNQPECIVTKAGEGYMVEFDS